MFFVERMRSNVTPAGELELTRELLNLRLLRLDGHLPLARHRSGLDARTHGSRYQRLCCRPRSKLGKVSWSIGTGQTGSAYRNVNWSLVHTGARYIRPSGLSSTDDHALSSCTR